MTFVHANFGDISDARLKQQLNRIHTSFRFSGDRNVKTGLTDEEAIECAVPLLFGRDNVCWARHIRLRTRQKNSWKEVRDVLAGHD